MKVTPTLLPEVLLIDPDVHSDARGFFFESWNARVFGEATGLDVEFVQDNHARSAHNVLRGIHYQVVRPQGKLIRVVSGVVFDVAVDLRHSSPNFGRWVAVEVSAENKRQVWVPQGFGHAYLVVSAHADVLYKATDYWVPEYDRCVAWNDPHLGIDWPGGEAPILAARDVRAPLLGDAEVFP